MIQSIYLVSKSIANFIDGCPFYFYARGNSGVRRERHYQFSLLMLDFEVWKHHLAQKFGAFPEKLNSILLFQMRKFTHICLVVLLQRASLEPVTYPFESGPISDCNYNCRINGSMPLRTNCSHKNRTVGIYQTSQVSALCCFQCFDWIRWSIRFSFSLKFLITLTIIALLRCKSFCVIHAKSISQFVPAIQVREYPR